MLADVAGLPLGEREVAVWYWRTESLDEAAVRAIDDVLSAEERSRRDRFFFAHDRRDYTAAHVLLRHLLSRYGSLAAADCRFTTNEYGKPSLVLAAGARPLAFNLSHTSGLVACAIARAARIGVDVERTRTMADLMDLARRYFAPTEIRVLESTAPAERPFRFAELWTLKESYIKALGGGLTVPLDSFAFELAGGRLHFTAPADATPWQFVLSAPSADTRLAVAVDPGPNAVPWRICFTDATRLAQPVKILGEG